MHKVSIALMAALALGACASLHELSSDVSSYSLWPAGRKPGTYAFERLPSQQANPQQQLVLEGAAQHAMAQAGFTPAPDLQSADVSVTLGARVTPEDRSPYDDPFWWHGGLYGYHRFGDPLFYRGLGPRFGYPFYDSPLYEREVAMLIRDRKTGQPLYEAHVTNDGYTASMGVLLPAMFDAGMKDFPRGGVNPHAVVTPIAAS